MGGTTSSVSGAGSTDDEGDPSASTGCSITSTAWGVSAAIGAAGFVSSGPPSGNFVASVSIQYPREYLPVLMNWLSPQCSFAMGSDRFTLVDQPTIMLRSVSHPSATTRITCGTTKRM